MLNFVYQRADQCVLMTTKGSSSSEKKAHVDPALLFQRLVTVARRSAKEEGSYFKYELCSHPLSLFGVNRPFRSPDKPELANAIAILANYDPTKRDVEHIQFKYVIDDGSLLHKIPWLKTDTFENLRPIL